MSVDFCDRAECARRVVTSDDLAFLDEGRAHLPSHDIAKLRTPLQVMETPEMEVAIRDALRRCRTRFQGLQNIESRLDPPVISRVVSQIRFANGRSDSDSEQSSDSDPSMYEPEESDARPPSCSVCYRGLTQPCWYCATCRPGKVQSTP